MLKSDNIVSLIEHFCIGNDVYIVLEFVEKGDLRGIIKHYKEQVPETIIL